MAFCWTLSQSLDVFRERKRKKKKKEDTLFFFFLFFKVHFIDNFRSGIWCFDVSGFRESSVLFIYFLYDHSEMMLIILYFQIIRITKRTTNGNMTIFLLKKSIYQFISI